MLYNEDGNELDSLIIIGFGALIFIVVAAIVVSFFS
jgi:hypothetical protein